MKIMVHSQPSPPMFCNKYKKKIKNKAFNLNITYKIYICPEQYKKRKICDMEKVYGAMHA